MSDHNNFFWSHNNLVWSHDISLLDHVTCIAYYYYLCYVWSHNSFVWSHDNFVWSHDISLPDHVTCIAYYYYLCYVWSHNSFVWSHDSLVWSLDSILLITVFVILIIKHNIQVYRVRSKWKFVLQDGIMNLKGHDYIFCKVNGEADW